MQDQRILEQIEILAAQYPWDQVALEIERQPDGEINFWAKLAARYDQGVGGELFHGSTPEEAITRMKENVSPEDRDPGPARDKKVAELREQIRKLEAVLITTPPYRPGTRIPQFVEVSSD